MDALYALIRHFEGLRLKAYLCPAGVWTCGFGSTGLDIDSSTVWTTETAENRMVEDVERFVSATRKLCPGIEGGNLAAISDFAYNLGLTRLKGSTLRKKINSRDIQGAKTEIVKWVYGGGKILPGLVLRRNVEAAMLK